MTSAIVRPRDETYFALLNYGDEELAGLQVSVAGATCGFLHQLGFRAILPGKTVFGQYYPSGHSLTMGINLFPERPISLTEPERLEPVVCAIVSDGSVTRIGDSVPHQDENGIIRVLVRSDDDRQAMDLAWRLYRLFERRPSFQREISMCQEASPRTAVDLTVRSLHPLDNPALAEQDDRRALVSFRVNARYSRLFL